MSIYFDISQSLHEQNSFFFLIGETQYIYYTYVYTRYSLYDRQHK